MNAQINGWSIRDMLVASRATRISCSDDSFPLMRGIILHAAYTRLKLEVVSFYQISVD